MVTLETVFERFGASLARIAASYEADRSLREDLVQEMLLAIHRALPQLRDPERLAPFVYRIAHNRGVSHVVRESARRRVVEHGPAEALDPETALLASERSRRVTGAVRGLPLPYRQVMTLVLEEVPHAEIAEALGLSVTNVAVRVNRAKALLREFLDER